MAKLKRLESAVDVRDDWDDVPGVVAYIVENLGGKDTVVGYVYRRGGRFCRKMCGWLL